MCGILGIVSKKDIISPMVEGLKKLAYRGYDSSGLATINNKTIIKRRASGKIENLEKILSSNPIKGNIGIAHTRWATHGVPNETNAHPHATNRVAIVHNGIIENYKDIIASLKSKFLLDSETDSEVIAHLFTSYLEDGLDINEAVMKLIDSLNGAFAIGILISNQNRLIAVRKGSPLAIGYGDNQNYIGSDAVGLAPYTKKISYLEDGDWAVLDFEKVQIFNKGREVKREINFTNVSRLSIEKGGFKHYMHKEIHEQPTAIGETLKSYIDLDRKTFNITSSLFNKDINRITMVACGTSSYACRVARFWFEKLANIPVHIDIASEYRYRNIIHSEDELVMFISQSGETRDTIACLEEVKKAKIKNFSIVNVSDSSIARLSDDTIVTLAGPEIGVASTKAFTTQLFTLLTLAIKLGVIKNQISLKEEKELIDELIEIPSLMNKTLDKESEIRSIASEIYTAKDILYIGRGESHAIALEGALKLKEISYIHAEGYAAGELKHGPIALVDENVPIIGILPTNKLFDKTASNLAEVYARGGKIIGITDEVGAKKIDDISSHIFTIEKCSQICQPIILTIPIQLLAYHIAVFKGTDVDQPRNLAKSVTVE
ncbi:MAG: Glutamine--fructose-6-phosphate aminotransferase [isomerizing] [Alphaproteobacteria bacterium MarineAlpha9_Bin4]|nr:glutamine--fructose-6-phosphate transaminase (isomerizing) [Pelagibacterales bacterium]PPR26320.1 MAG: Glutamine--fructose-6-phosphate aminotransferase [isomerizing] [Alphaproteobacteria bacterium MarineAlpha9_Bin4]